MLNKEEIEKAKEQTKKWIYNMRTGRRVNIIHKGDKDFCDDLETLLQYIDQLEEYLEIISKQLDNVAIDQIPIGIAELQQENKRLTHTNKSYKGMINKQNKIIDEMAEQLSGLPILDIKKAEYITLGNKEETKQYFEKKVEEK